jgi:hypothetical protein
MARDTSPTERRGYERPPIGDDWADAWDGLVEDSDELAVERGPIADRPSTGAYDDAMYYAVDQRTLWRWDAAASDWEAAAGLGTASDPVPGTSHFESVSTNDVSFKNITIGQDKLLALGVVNDDTIVSKVVRWTDNVSTASEIIWEPDNATGDTAIGFQALIQGSDGADRFTDLIIYTRGGSVSIVAESSSGSPTTRSYSVGSDDLNLSMGSGTYRVGVFGSTIETL